MISISTFYKMLLKKNKKLSEECPLPSALKHWEILKMNTCDYLLRRQEAPKTERNNISFYITEEQRKARFNNESCII